MENPSRFRNDQYGNDDYAQLEKWSPHIPYKPTIVHDNSSLIYTSDYGSYSSQESNHSGTTYSNLADCEEALHSPPSVAYDLPPPQPPSMEKRRDKPLPPPRMTSRVQTLTSKPRLSQPAKEKKKISFDDSAMANYLDADKMNPDDAIPSFATLPRKKKLVSKPMAGPTQAAPQVTWMKDVAQKAELISRSKSANTVGVLATNKKPQGILKNKVEEQKKGDTTGYINRNTVQRILQQQRTATNRQSTVTLPPQVYKSTTGLLTTSSPETLAPSHKAWEYNFNGNNSTATAQVIGVFEPNSEGSANNHKKQNSADTEFEFPPPPSDHDISQIMLPGKSPPVQSAKSNDFTPLNLACHRDNAVPSPGATCSKPVSAIRTHSVKPQANNKPPVPLRPRKPVTNNGEIRTLQQTAVVSHGVQSTTPLREPKIPPKRITTYNTKDALQSPRLPINSNDCADDIVLPPPPEFQGGTGSSAILNEQPSYGDYELLSPDISYHCNIHPIASPRSLPQTHANNQNSYHRIAVENLQRNLRDNLKASSPEYTKTNSSQPSGKGLKYPPPYSHSRPNDIRNNTRENLRTNFINHRHQYSTEL